MVGSSRIDLHHLNLDELVGVVNLYPWYSGARLELCRRMSRMGDAWDDDQYAPEALYLPQRSVLVNLLKRSRQGRPGAPGFVPGTRRRGGGRGRRRIGPAFRSRSGW